MGQSPLSFYVFVVVLVRRGFRYLLVEEARAKDRGKWYLPAGALRTGEDLRSAGAREVAAWTGLAVEVTGLVAIEHMPVLPGWDFGRWRFVVEARIRPDSPQLDPQPELALGAQFFMPHEVDELPLRGEDAATIVRHHAAGQVVAPIELYQIGLR